ncbi:Redoxin-domain-containing protein [Lentinula aciculospora]|uniref:Redoxin-domain-containing protein n=1 Tax=Lentinula aciculospora TaxID=153920 RepID=A0A9W9DXI3_9AGAR|nr:Redoxin-domain-containing protein [Lentinula aciculospora]
MTSLISTSAEAAHSLAVSLLSKAQIQPGAIIPEHSVKETAPDTVVPLKFHGKNVIVGVPGAFSGTCTVQIPGYIQNYDRFKAKSVNEVYVVAVNDVFAMKAWKEHLAPAGTSVRFMADDKGAFTSALGLMFDATPKFGAPRSKRYVIIAENDKVESIFIEEDPSKVTITGAETVLSHLT